MRPETEDVMLGSQLPGFMSQVGYLLCIRISLFFAI